MTGRLSTLLIAALCGGLIAGCGSAGSTTSSSRTRGSSGARGIPGSPRAVADCERAVEAEKTLSANAKGKLDGLCQQVARGNTAPLEKVEREICDETLERSGVSAGLAKTEAATICTTK